MQRERLDAGLGRFKNRKPFVVPDLTDEQIKKCVSICGTFNLLIKQKIIFISLFFRSLSVRLLWQE